LFRNVVALVEPTPTFRRPYPMQNRILMPHCIEFCGKTISQNGIRESQRRIRKAPLRVAIRDNGEENKALYIKFDLCR
jgi:hypothetical protein